MGLIIVIIVLGLGIGFTTFYIVRNMVAPKKIARVEQLLKQNKSGAAVKTAKQLLAKDQRNPEAHYLLGRAYQQDGKPELALMEYKMVNQIGVFDGTIPEIPFRREIARLFMRFNQPDEALKEYLLLLQKDPNTAENYFQVGELFESRNKAAKAVGYYRKAIELQRGHGAAHLRLGLILYRAKKFGEAQQFLEKALRFQPESYEAYYFIGRIQKENKDYAAALHSFEWSTKSPEYKIKSLVERGTSFMEMNNLEQAVSELERAITQIKNPEDGDALWAHYFLATCYERMRKIERAIEHWESVYKVKPGFQDVAEKISQYQELRQDDVVKDFLTASQTDFRGMCEKATAAMGFAIQSITDEPNGAKVIAVEAKSNWRTTKAMPHLIRFVRIAELIDEATVRETHEEMKNENINRAAIVTSTNFSRKALDFAESRPINLLDKDKLQQLLKR
ncbi:MAG: tetratricopeptide repeat protein [Spirochaeta sp.]|jgi:tetratricopeptide (TPR) repeat protein|nr:tetratricopeptide repeat protein [Spirochaeta sp.]